MANGFIVHPEHGLEMGRMPPPAEIKIAETVTKLMTVVSEWANTKPNVDKDA